MMFNILGLACGVIWILYNVYSLLHPRVYKDGVKLHHDSPFLMQLAELFFLLFLFVKAANYFGIEQMLLGLTTITFVLWITGFIFKKMKNWHFLHQLGTLFPILFLVVLLRTFVIEPYVVPSGSLLPTLEVGDFILVNKFDYGLRLPITHKTIFKIGNPKSGDIMVFLWPVNPSMYFVKRVIGVPGDRIRYSNKLLYRNGELVHQQIESFQTVNDGSGGHWPATKSIEKLNGVSHEIYLRPDVPGRDMDEIVVPPNEYFMMGDNRDGSFDSRGWGFVPDNLIVGKATIIFFSWDSEQPLLHRIRWNRIGKKI